MYFLVLLISVGALANINFGKDFSFSKLTVEEVQAYLSEKISAENQLLPALNIQDRALSVSYTIDEELNEKIVALMKRYRSDYTAVAVIDNNSGAVIALSDYSKKDKSSGVSLAIANTHPAASIFKVVTAADLLVKKEISPDSIFNYNGRGVTLYKNQLKNTTNRWSRKIKLERAFAYSNNVVFGKAAMNNTDYASISSTATKLGFNDNPLQFLRTPDSKILKAETAYELAELASGFNRRTVMSPLHAAGLMSIIANDGLEQKSYVVDSIRDNKRREYVWRHSKHELRVLSEEVAKNLQRMMQLTIKSGTARGSFRAHKLPRHMRSLEIGGKTGTITGGFPYGKRDWFVSYAKPKNSQDKGISIAVMIINEKKWYIKSTVIAKDIMNYYFSKVRS